MSSQNLFSSLKTLWRRPVARILTSICLLAILMANLPLGDLRHTIAQISPWLWSFVVVAFIGGHVIGVVKWRLFINMGPQKLPFSIAFKCYFAGLFSNFFLPSIVGGDVVRAGLAIWFKGKKEAVLLGGVLDRFLDTSSLGLIILAGALSSPTSLAAQDRTILLSLLFSVIIFVAGVFLFILIPVPKTIPKGLYELIERIRSIIRQLIKKPQIALAGFVLAIVIQSGFVLLNATLGAACNINLPLYVWFIAWPLAKLSAMIPVSLGGLGIRETALALFLSRFDVPISSSVGLGLLWETVIVAGGGMGGIFYFLARKNHSGTDSGVIKTISAEDRTARLFDNPD